MPPRKTSASAFDKELEKKEKLRRSWPRLEMEGQYPGEPIYINRRIYEGVLRKVTVISSSVIGRKLIIEYMSKVRGGKCGIGRLELLDIGP